MTDSSMLDGWLGPRQLAEEMSRVGDHVTEEWVRDRMASGEIPSVKIGRRRYFTPDCRDELSARIQKRRQQQTDTSGYGRVPRIGQARGA